MRLVGKLDEHEQVVEAKALRGLPLLTIAVDARKGDVVPGDAADIVLTAPILSSATGFELLAIN